MVREGKNPHVLDLNKAPVAIKRAYDFWNDGDFDELMERALDDPYHVMHDIVDRLSDAIPGMERMPDEEIRKEVERMFYTLEFGPDGYAEPWDDANRCPKEGDEQ